MPTKKNDPAELQQALMVVREKCPDALRPIVITLLELCMGLETAYDSMGIPSGYLKKMGDMLEQFFNE